MQTRTLKARAALGFLSEPRGNSPARRRFAVNAVTALTLVSLVLVPSFVNAQGFPPAPPPAEPPGSPAPGTPPLPGSPAPVSPPPGSPPTSPPPTDPAPGLLPPPVADVHEQETLRSLEQADREDSGRGLQFVWLAPDVGVQWVSLDGLSDDGLLDGLVESETGLALGAGAGLRWLFFTGGARFRYAPMSTFTLWSLGGEFALRVPLGSFEPYLLAGVGYARAASFEADQALRTLGANDPLVLSGINARLGGGFDYYVTPVFSTGVAVDVESLFLFRDALLEGSDTAFDEGGSGVGIAATGMLVLGLHF